MPKSKTTQKTAKPISKLAASVGFISFSIGLILLLFFVFTQSPTSAQAYPIKGFDVSHHQKNIQWQKISTTDYKFVYLKATEGGDFKDKRFQENWLKARERGFLVGAYHFYRLCRDGNIQAQNFINTVPTKKDALPPVIDLEYDSKCINTYSKEELLAEIQIMHDRLKAHYGKQPIFYISKSFYNIVLAGQFNDVPLWVREYKGQPALSGDPNWIFWQHTNQGTIKGISTTVDLNVFHGNEKQWDKFLELNNIKSY